MLTQAELKQLLIYDPVTGVFTNKTTRNSRSVAGDESGTLLNIGYRQVTLNNKRYFLHRLAWLYVHGQFPDQELDHVNGNRADNRIDNLRLVSKKQNMENQCLRADNRSGYRGVSWSNGKKKWIAQVCHNNKRQTVGRFDTVEEAALAAKQARDQLFTHHKTEYAA